MCYRPSAFKQPFAADFDRAKEMTRAIGMFIAVDKRPFSVVEGNKGVSAPRESARATLTNFALMHPFQQNR